MNWNIVTDSSCDLKPADFISETEDVKLYSVPFIIHTGDKDYVDDENIDVNKLVDDMEAHDKTSRTSCPSPQTWLQCFKMKGHTIALTISKELSGSFNSAHTAIQELKASDHEKKISLINSLSTGPALIALVYDILWCIKAGMSFEEVVEHAKKCSETIHTVFALCSFNNLVRNGRMSPLAGFLARKLNFWGIGIGDNGKIKVKSKTHGSKNAIKSIIDDIRESTLNIKTVIISHCQNQTAAELLKQEILKIWGGAHIEIFETRGLDSFYAERHGLIVVYS
jgi:DegV family protein with EDD domain